MTKLSSSAPLSKEETELLTSYTLMGEYQQKMQSFLFPNGTLPNLEQQADENAPFLSVIMRTQGKRFEALKEALLCLQSQTDDDFEVILIVHKGDDEGKASVLKLLDTLTPDFRAKVRHEHLDTGTRTAPLNFGASLARGSYFAMLDDDDLLFDNWVENFHTAALKHPHSVIRCYGCTQAWKAVETPTGVRLKSDGSIINQYCTPFQLTAHLEDNQTPISCVAIPSFCYHLLGLRFDDTLTTAEDWDYIMRCILTVGVHDTECITFLYRLWSNIETSRTMHAQKEWAKNRKAIYKKLDQIPIITDRQSILQNMRTITTVDGTTQTVVITPGNREHYMTPYSIKLTCKYLLHIVKCFLRCRMRVNKHAAIIKASPYFDEEWYLEQYPDVNSSGLDAAKHYLIYGWHELRDPSLKFSTRNYLEAYTDVADADVCPLLHYERSGKHEQREVMKSDLAEEHNNEDKAEDTTDKATENE
jgi:glycosyltransferase involved in cell wall biosynthesis